MIDPEEVEFLRESLSTDALPGDLRGRISHEQLVETGSRGRTAVERT